MASERVCVGVITSPHGVRGMVRIKPFTGDPKDVAAYGPVSLEDGTVHELTVRNLSKGLVLAALDGITTREMAEGLKGKQLFIERSALPDPGKGNVYQVDLVGKKVMDPERGLVGTVVDVQDHGAGAMLEIDRPEAGSVLVPFGGDNPIEVDGDAIRLSVDTAWLEE